MNIFAQKVRIILDFLLRLWYNTGMDTKNLTTKSNTEMVTVSRAEYEDRLASITTLEESIGRLEQSVTELKAENQWLLEQLGLPGGGSLAPALRSPLRRFWSR